MTEKKKAVTNFLHGTLQRRTKEPKGSIISMGFKRKKENYPYNVNNSFAFF